MGREINSTYVQNVWKKGLQLGTEGRYEEAVKYFKQAEILSQRNLESNHDLKEGVITQ